MLTKNRPHPHTIIQVYLQYGHSTFCGFLSPGIYIIFFLHFLQIFILGIGLTIVIPFSNKLIDQHSIQAHTVER